MKCPVCQIELKMTDRQGVEIDYCPQCRGVWLDRGELDKIIDRSAALSETQEYGRPNTRPDEFRQEKYDHDDDDDHRSHDPRHRKRKSFLGELFDFD